jgi:hypothetical protein
MKFILLASLFMSLQLFAETPLESIYGDANTVNIKSVAFTKTYPEFGWNGTNHRIAVSKSSKLFGGFVRESIAYFSAHGNLVRLDAWIYNRGDDGILDQTKFEQKYNALIQKLSTHFNTAPKKNRSDGATRSTAYIFQVSPKQQVRLLVGFEGKGKSFKAEYISLVIRNYSKEDKITDEKGARKFIKNEANGDVFIDRIPMIDQGPKGYCVPATIARIGQHYGADISMHEIAMISQTQDGGGTSPRLAMGAVKKNRPRIGLGVYPLKVKYGIRAYDASSSKIKAFHANLEDDNRDYLKFKKAIIAAIDRGRIIAWSMMVGVWDEKGMRASENLGGHMRMIIGYNKKTDEVIFSDSWNRKEGDGHEFKKWPFKQAYVVTSSLYDVKP